MSAVSPEVRALAEEAATAFSPPSTSPSRAHPELPSSLTLYRTGRVLYSCHANGGTDGNRGGTAGALVDAFEDMTSCLPANHLQGALRNLHHAHASLIVSFAASATTTSPAISALGSMMGKPAVVSSSWKDIAEGAESICGVYLSSATACRSCCASSNEGRNGVELPFISLSWVYDYLCNHKEDEPHKEAMQQLVLRALSRLLVSGIVQGLEKSGEDADEQLSSIMTLIQNIQSSLGDYNCALGDMSDLGEHELGEPSFVNALRSKFQSPDGSQPPQLQYLLAMLRASPKSNGKRAPSAADIPQPSPKEEAPQSAPQLSMTDIQIDRVKSVLPDLGEGYIEEALKCYNHDVERTLEALLQAAEGGANSNVHPRLLTIPTNLPRKLKDSVDRYSANVNLHRGATARDDGKEHAKIQKRHIKHVEKQAEEEAFLIDNVSRSLGGMRVAETADDDDQYALEGKDEYNDDYDDQYDGIGDDGGMAGGIGGMDEGLYDIDVHNVHQRYDRSGAKNDQDMWRKYNSLIKEVDTESKFWEQNRNLNRDVRPVKGRGRKQKNEDEEEIGEEKQFRGPDKGKGGRLIGPDGKYLPIKRGGKKGRGGGGGGGGGGAGDGNNAAGRGAGRGGRGGKGGRGGGGRGGDGTNAKGDSKATEGDMSKVQKRRKDANKAKIGNHHRKDRANKKAAGGMVM